MRQFDVTKDDGSRWLMLFTSEGVKWVRNQAGPPQPPEQEPAPRPFVPPLPQHPFVAGALAFTRVAEVGVKAWQTWEMRQQFLRAQESTELNQQIDWVYSMLKRWAHVHSAGDRLDMKSSMFFARQVDDLVATLVSGKTNKRLQIPQELVYDVDQVGEAFTAMRESLIEQLIPILTDRRSVVRELLGQLSPLVRVDLEWLRQVGEAPAPMGEGQTDLDKKKQRAAEVELPLTQSGVWEKLFVHLSADGAAQYGEQENESDANKVFARLKSAVGGVLPTRSESLDGRAAQAANAEFPELVAVVEEIRRVWVLTQVGLILDAVVSLKTGEHLAVAVGENDVQAELVSTDDSRLSLPSLVQPGVDGKLMLEKSS